MINDADMKKLMRELIREQLPETSCLKFEEQVDKLLQSQDKMKFNLLFSGMPRLVGKDKMKLNAGQLSQLQAGRAQFSPAHWSVDRFCRVYLLSLLEAGDDKATYVARIEELFSVAEVQEQVALYSALPLYQFPQAFIHRCTEGIRTNMTDVFDAVALENPYPSEQLEEAAWNQMVLKALFMERPIYRITGLDERANPQLARILSDYAHERWSAGRRVSPELWRCFGPFMDEQLFSDMQLLLDGKDAYREEAAVLACMDSSYPGSNEILTRHSGIAEKARSGELSWDQLGKAFAAGN